MNLQLLGCHLLFDVPWTAVEYPEQCLFVEARDLSLYGLNIGDCVTIRQRHPRAADGRSGWGVIKD